MPGGGAPNQTTMKTTMKTTMNTTMNQYRSKRRRTRWSWRWFRGPFSTRSTHLDSRLRFEVGGARAVTRYVVSQKELPAFRFVDLYRAVDAYLAAAGHVGRIASHNTESLNTLLHRPRNRWDSRRITKSPRMAWTVGPDQEVFFPIDQYWIFPEGELGVRAIVRLRYDRECETAVLAVAGVDADRVDALIKRLTADSIATSIYRERLITLSYEAGTRDEFGDVEKTERLRVSFTVAAPVSRQEFVVDEGLYKLLWRNVVDLYQRREVLKTHGVPIRRGVLLYGPPGTGKTFACRYLCGQLDNTTRIVVTGSALNRIGQLFDFARIYQPSIVILEDVDLAFAARDISLYTSSLGDLLDQMDGLRPTDEVGVILTTNSIERLEAAIKDRPGRISQCVYFGPPGETLRRRYIEQYARGYDYTATDVERLVEMSDGTTPAFIKEWVHRTVQIATEDLDGDAKLRLANDDFQEAFDEMKRSAGGSSARIVGFLQETAIATR